MKSIEFCDLCHHRRCTTNATAEQIAGSNIRFIKNDGDARVVISGIPIEKCVVRKKILQNERIVERLENMKYEETPQTTSEELAYNDGLRQAQKLLRKRHDKRK